MSKPLKFDPIELEHLRIRANGANEAVLVEDRTTTLLLRDAKTTAALIAALQVALKAQQEAETLTFADLKPGEWFQVTSEGVDECVRVKMIGGYANEYYSNCSCNCCRHVPDDTPVRRIRATFTEETDE